MISIKRSNSSSADFHKLVTQLDNDLISRYREKQKVYAEYNTIENIDTVVIAYFENQAVGCGCFKKFNENTIEIKRMFVKPEFRGKGISKDILRELETWGKQLGYTKAILETGKDQPEAIGLYERFGYNRIDNFGQYVGMENSICMMKTLV